MNRTDSYALGRRQERSLASWRSIGRTLLAFFFFPLLQSAGQEKDRNDFFEARIRPVLIAECYACHSTEAQAKGKLRGALLLDSRDGMRKGGDTGPAVVPGDLEKSLIVKALRHQELEMPPKGKLSDSIIADFEKWIIAGAEDPRTSPSQVLPRSIDWEQGRLHWSFQRLSHRVAPPPWNDDTIHNGVDAFLRQAQGKKHVVPNKVAEVRTLIRRAWFDLLGLPPSPQEVDAWTARLRSSLASRQVTNKAGVSISLDEWERMIDHLLSSPHYGERWARHWMDVARFAESHGYEQDYDRPHAYHYRDFLIRAFNSDMPYDQFVKWQLAGDELATEDPLAWMATGFLGAGAFPTQLTEAEFESARYDELDDMVSTTGVAFLGLSIGCARCHDHKFDPITSQEYYQFAAVFSSVIRAEKSFDLDPEANRRARTQHEKELREKRSKLQAMQKETPQRLARWLEETREHQEEPHDWQVWTGTLQSQNKSKYQLQEDESYLAIGKAPDKDELTWTLSPKESLQVAGLRIEALTDDSLPHRGPGRANNGNFALGNITVSIANREKEIRQVRLSGANATHQQNDTSLGIAATLDEDPISGWAVDGQIGKDQAAAFWLESPHQVNAGETITVRLTFHHPNAKHAIGGIRFSTTPNRNAKLVVGRGTSPKVAAQLRELREWVESKATNAEDRLAAVTNRLVQEQDRWKEVRDWFQSQQLDARELQETLNKMEKSGPPIKMTTVQVASEGLPHMKHHADDRGYPHFYPKVHHLRRGDVHQKGEVANPAPLTVLVSKNKGMAWSESSGKELVGPTSGRRSQLAHWIVDVDHGSGALAARVMVNRLWQHHFGRGLVATPNDFGLSGEKTHHPELLEWLAQELVSGEWKLKRMHRLIMTSQAYMQSSQSEEDALNRSRNRVSKDPENTTYWRRYPRRLEAEALRDTLLSVSGKLESQMYGPGSLDEKMRRRSVYFFIKRSQLIPSMMLFDWPEHLVSIGQRSTTTIAPQALLLMNSPLGRDASEGLVQRVFMEPAMADATVEKGIQSAYRIIYQRLPSENEVELGKRYLKQLQAARDVAKRNPEASSPIASSLPRECWHDYCQALLSANEFIFVD